MSATTLMARILDEELEACGVFGIGARDCEEIVRAMMERIAGVANESLSAELSLAMVSQGRARPFRHS